MKRNHEVTGPKECHFTESAQGRRRSTNSIEKMLRLQQKMTEFSLTYAIRRPDK